MVEGIHHHRSTLKQQNKAFKSKHATKGSMKDAAKGRIARLGSTAGPNKVANAAAESRVNRRNRARQSQIKKRNTLMSATRVFSGVDGAPRIVAVVPLTGDVSSKKTVASLAESLDMAAEDCPEDGVWKLKADRFKTTLQFRTIAYKSFFSAMDACKIADYVIFVLSPTVEVNEFGDTLLRTLQAQGLPEVVTVMASNPSVDPKSKSDILRSLLSFIQYFVPSQERVYDLQASSDKLNALRSLSEGKPRDVRWRDGRSWVLGESTDWENGILKLTGVVRGASLCANRLVHLSNFGDFQISKILSAPILRQSKSGQSANLFLEPTLLAEPDASSADSLVSRIDEDDMANEQTWPTEEEMNAGTDADGIPNIIPEAQNGTTPKRIRHIPKGVSEYQAAWILDDTDDEGDAEVVEEGEKMDSGDEVQTEAAKLDREDEEMQDLPLDEDREMEIESRKTVAFKDLDNEEEEEQLRSWRIRRREEEDDHSFPDEIDTPDDVPARERFQRFRGMRSFRTSPWDAYENLPRDYARIFQFEDFHRTERSVRRKAEQEFSVVEPGVRVTVYIKGVPKEASSSNSLLTLFSLLQHEHKVTVLNFTVQRNTEYDGSVRSKDSLILCVGPRRLSVNPVYSQHTRGGGKGANNVHKFERYLRHGLVNVATVYGPVVYGNQPCVLLRESPDGQAPHLVATGTFLNPDTNRVIAKRIILTGHPFKVHKKTATVRYMFFNSDDVHYYKPVQLHTKHGRTGHIRESLGTHGYFKAHFDAPISQMDTVCMSLYKRVFPKWARLWNEKKSDSLAALSEEMAIDE